MVRTPQSLRIFISAVRSFLSPETYSGFVGAEGRRAFIIFGSLAEESTLVDGLEGSVKSISVWKM